MRASGAHLGGPSGPPFVPLCLNPDLEAISHWRDWADEAGCRKRITATIAAAVRTL
jgi:hypothetical protein